MYFCHARFQLLQLFEGRLGLSILALCKRLLSLIGVLCNRLRRLRRGVHTADADEGQYTEATKSGGQNHQGRVYLKKKSARPDTPGGSQRQIARLEHYLASELDDTTRTRGDNLAVF